MATVRADNSGRSANNIANVARPSRSGTIALPLPIPVRGNRPPPPPQVFVPMPVKPGPNAYPLTGYKSPGDVQTILNQPAAVLLDGSPEAAAYQPPSVTEPPRQTGPGNFPSTVGPSQAPVDAPQAMMPIAPPADEIPAWQNPKYVAPVVAVVVAVVAFVAFRHFSKRPTPPPTMIAPPPTYGSWT